VMVQGQDRSTVHSALVILSVLDAWLAHLAVTAVFACIHQACIKDTGKQ
jgi:hypothetical protein